MGTPPIDVENHPPNVEIPPGEIPGGLQDRWQVVAVSPFALEESGVSVRVVSMPCMELFRDQEADYRQQVLGDKPRIVVEAGVRTGWDEWMQAGDAFVGMSSFGVSAPAGDAFAHFGITAEAVVARALTLTGK